MLSVVLKKLTISKENIKTVVLHIVAALLIGILGGALGAGLVHGVHTVTALREHNGFVLYFLPLAGLVIIALYRVFRTSGMGTSQVLESAAGDKKISPWLIPAVLLGTLLTHLCGGSAGKEGAALQLGGGLAVTLGKLFRAKDETVRLWVYCGMAALFSAAFGTPITAAVFALEVVRPGRLPLSAVLPCGISAVSSYGVAVLLGAGQDGFVLPTVSMSASVMWRVCVLAVAGALIGKLFCYLLHTGETVFKRLLKNEWLRVVVGAFLIVVLTLLLGTTMYNGGGIEAVRSIFAGETVDVQAFLLKIIFTVITVAAGFKGGEIIPIFFVGGTFGFSFAVLIGLHPLLGTAVGMMVLFCSTTKCVLATAVLSAELFYGACFPYLAIAAMLGFAVSGKRGLYGAQRMDFDMLK